MELQMEETLSTSISEVSSTHSTTSEEVEDQKTLVVAITGASGNVAYSLAFMIGQGAMFGPSRSVILHLIGRPSSLKEVEGLKLELDDADYELLEDIKVFDNCLDGFKDIDIALLVGG